MRQRTGLITASRVVLIPILLPIIGWLDATCSLAASGVAVGVATRVLALPARRRATQPMLRPGPPYLAATAR
jgi:hypothetical protein